MKEVLNLGLVPRDVGIWLGVTSRPTGKMHLFSAGSRERFGGVRKLGVLKVVARCIRTIRLREIRICKYNSLKKDV